MDPKDCANFGIWKTEGEDIFQLDLNFSTIM